MVNHLKINEWSEKNMPFGGIFVETYIKAKEKERSRKTDLLA
jgi:hypothetical protein